MTSPETLPSIAPAPAGASPETLAAADAMYERAGYSPEQRKAAGFGSAPVAPPVVNNTTTTTPLGSSVAIMAGSGISREQAISAARNLVNHGVDPATVANAAAAHGLEPKNFTANPPSPEAIAAAQRDAELAEGFAPPVKGESYLLQFPREFAAASDIGDLVELAADFEAGFKTAGVPTALAQPLLDCLLQTGEVYASDAMTDAAAETRWREELALFNKISRDPTEDNRLAVLGFGALPKAMQERLAETHAVHSAAARFQLAALGRAIEYRAGRASKKGK